MNYRLNILTVTFVCSMLMLCAHAVQAKDEIYSLVESTKLARYSDITFFVRMPHSGEADLKGKSSRRKASSVRGVLALCTWSIDAEDVRSNVEGKGRFKQYVKFADKHNLALVTWTNFKGYKIGTSGDEMDEEKYKHYNKSYDQRAREWKNGFNRLCRKYNLPAKNTLLYGISGGGQMGHRGEKRGRTQNIKILLCYRIQLFDSNTHCFGCRYFLRWAEFGG